MEPLEKFLFRHFATFPKIFQWDESTLSEIQQALNTQNIELYNPLEEIEMFLKVS